MSFLYPFPKFLPPYSLPHSQGYVRRKTLNWRTYKYLNKLTHLQISQYLTAGQKSRSPTGVTSSKLHKFLHRALKQTSESRIGGILCEVWGYQRVASVPITVSQNVIPSSLVEVRRCLGEIATFGYRVKDKKSETVSLICFGTSPKFYKTARCQIVQKRNL